MASNNQPLFSLSVALLLVLLVAPKFAQAQELVWAKQMSGPNEQNGKAVAVDTDGNVYTTGYFADTVDFDPGDGDFTLTAKGFGDVFVSKLDHDGNLVWARQIGGENTSDIAAGFDLAVDDDGNIYVTGDLDGVADFDPGPAVHKLVSAGSRDLFICKLSNDGDLVWARRIGGPGDDRGAGIALDSDGNVYTTEYFEGSVDFDPGVGVHSLTSAGSTDAYILKLDNDGNFIWARGFGGAGRDSGLNLAVDESGMIYTTGSFWETADLDPGSAVLELTSAGRNDIFVSKLDTAGNLLWARQMGGIGSDGGWDVAVDLKGSVYTTGISDGLADFDPSINEFILTGGGSRSAFVSKLDSSGKFVWARRIGATELNPKLNGSEEARGIGVAVGQAGGVYTTGLFVGTIDFDPGVGTASLTSLGLWDAFVSKLDSSGNFVWAGRIAGSHRNLANDLTVDDVDNIYVVGHHQGDTDFDAGPDSFNLSSHQFGPNQISLDVFVAKYTDLPASSQPPVISEGGIVLATLAPTVNTISHLSIISVFGQNFATESTLFPTLDGDGNISKVLGGTCLEMNGERLPLFAVTPGQINAQASARFFHGSIGFSVIANCDAPVSSALHSETVGLTASPRAYGSAVETAIAEVAAPGFFILTRLRARGISRRDSMQQRNKHPFPWPL